MQTDALIWILAGVGLGVFLTMSAFALVVAVDGRAIRRKVRRVEAASEAPAPAIEPSAPAEAAAAPAVVASKGPQAVAAPVSQAPAAMPEVHNDAPAAEQAAPATEAPAGDKPAPSIEEMFARAFEAAVPTTPRDGPHSEPAKS